MTHPSPPSAEASDARPDVRVCALCGEPIFAFGCPSRCPACGAHPHLLRVPRQEVAVLGRSGPVPEGLEPAGRRAVAQEVDTAEIYSRIAASARHPLLVQTFRVLQRIEARHAALLAVAFRVRRPRPTVAPDFSEASEQEMLAAVRAREDDTIALYRHLEQACAGTEHAEIFQALMAVEADHNLMVDRLEPLADGAF